MILQLENTLPQMIADGDTSGIYRALKVYLLVGGQGEGGGAEDDAAITAHFDDAWRGQFNSAGQIDDRERLRKDQWVLGEAAARVGYETQLVEAVEEETRLVRLYEQVDELDAASIVAGGGELGNDMGDAMFRRVYSRSGVFQRVILNNLSNRDKVQTRAGGNALAKDTQRRQVESISEDFAQ